MDKEVKVDKQALRALVLDFYGKYSTAAKAINIKPSQFSRNLNKPHKKFLIDLKRVGIPVETVMEEKLTTKHESDIKNFIIKISNLEKLLEEKNKIIEHQELMISRFEKLLDDKKK